MPTSIRFLLLSLRLDVGRRSFSSPYLQHHFNRTGPMLLCHVELTHSGQEGGLNTRIQSNAPTHGRVKLPTLTVDTAVT